MIRSRRHFLQMAALSSAMLGLAPRIAQASDGGTATRKDSLNLLMLGGTGFLGPHIVERALSLGHSVTLFNRGKTNKHLFPELTKIRGDRDPQKGEGLSALKKAARAGEWDAVIDTSAYVPRIASASARLLAKAAKQYLFVSTISVYAAHDKVGADESEPVGTLEDESDEKVTGESYGPLKALCEQAVREALPGRMTTVRPGLIVGPRDRSDRFTYWPVRVRRGGEILAPGSPHDPIQYIDVRDLAAFIVNCIESRSLGTYNATGPTSPTNIAELLHGCKAVSGGDARFTWVDANTLKDEEVSPWADMPMWVPAAGEMLGFGSKDISKAVAAGLTSRPLAETVQDTLSWYDSLPEKRRARLRAGIAPKREAEVLAAWHARARG